MWKVLILVVNCFKKVYVLKWGFVIGKVRCDISEINNINV